VIDVKKTASLKKKGKTHYETLDIHNKVKIITSTSSTFALWSRLLEPLFLPKEDIEELLSIWGQVFNAPVLVLRLLCAREEFVTQGF
jgi:hypothetical protein